MAAGREQQAKKPSSGRVDHTGLQKMAIFFDDPRRRLSGAVCVVLFAVFVRQCVAAGPYSGMATPPMYGDFEAQRHWMEVTTALPVSEWYRETPDNNLSYWGLDYPPLTAYHAWACGRVAHRVRPGLVELHASRGHETYEGKFFMRWTVIASDLLFLFPPAYLFFLRCAPAGAGEPRSAGLVGWFLFLLNPALLLVDHGHFQYNGVSLGLAVAAVVALRGRHRFWGSVLYCLSFCFKQMSLYYAPAFFFYLLGGALRRPSLAARARGVAVPGAAVLLALATCFAPFLGSADALLAVLARVFPFQRGLFEDKVANFWCATNVLVKWQQVFSRDALARASLAATLAALLPTGVDLARRPSWTRFLYAMCSSALAFYLFGFQVHEKTVLLPLLPAMLLMPRHQLACSWATIVATASMFPLLRRDGLTHPYLVSQAYFVWAAYSAAYRGIEVAAERRSARRRRPPALLRAASALSVAALVVLHLAAAVMPDLPRYPDLKAVAFTSFAAAHFLVALLALGYYQIFVLPDDCDGALEGGAAEVVAGRKKRD